MYEQTFVTLTDQLISNKTFSSCLFDVTGLTWRSTFTSWPWHGISLGNNAFALFGVSDLSLVR